MLLGEALGARKRRCKAEPLAMQLLAAGIAAGPLLSIEQALTHPQTAANGMFFDTPEYRGAGLPMRFLRPPGAIRRGPPQFGAHAEELLAEFGVVDDERQ